MKHGKEKGLSGKLSGSPFPVRGESGMAEPRRDINKALAKSLKELTVHRPFDKITVREIADGAGVIRATFYRHFQDKYDLLRWIVQTEILDPVHILMVNEMYREAIRLIFLNLLHDREFYQHAARMEGQNSFSEISRESIYRFLYGLFTAQIGNRRQEHIWMTPEYLASYYAESMNFVVMRWIETGMKASPDEMVAVYEYIGTRSLGDLLPELK